MPFAQLARISLKIVIIMTDLFLYQFILIIVVKLLTINLK